MIKSSLLKRKRQYLGLTRNEMADKLEVSVYTINDYEISRSLPTLKNFYKVCKAYELTNEEVIEYLEYLDEVLNQKNIE